MFELSIIIVCLFFNAILAGAETAFIAVSRPTLRELAKTGNERAKMLLEMRKNPERTLSVVQIGITFVGALAAAVGGAGAEEIIAPWLVNHFGVSELLAEVTSLLLVVIPFTYVTVVLGELVPKTLALRKPLLFASESAPWLQKISRVLNPFVSVFEWSTKKIVNLFSKKQIVHEEHHDAIELEEMAFPNRQYVLNIMKIEKTTVSEIAVRWAEVIYLEDTFTSQQVENVIITSAHTRLPVLRHQEVIGIINAKEFLAFQKTGDEDWFKLIRPTVRMRQDMPILTALQILQEKKAHLAIVYRENSKIGIVTMEAIFEEIIGDIYDEDDDGAVQRILSTVKFKT